MDREIDTVNDRLVGGVSGNRVVVMRPFEGGTPEEAFRHAAWLVAVAEAFTDAKFEDVLEAVRGT